ncbi:MAG: RNA polymerase factor sigma-32 [Deltaproteobacteria bacterium]|nr:RNA polymerase factor sigma-32 [Deltaproteobacteria bacterium]
MSEESKRPPASSGALARVDPLTRYLNEIGRHQLLTREEEHELAVRYQEQGDVDAAYKLVTANLRLVVKIANEYRRAAFNLLDLIQEGNVGLMLAVKKFDPYKGVKLSTYAAWWIRAYIIRYVMDNWRMVKLGTTQAQRKLFFNLRKEKRRLENLGFKPEAKLLAANLDVTEKEVVEMEQRLGASEPSIDTPYGDEEGGQTLGDRLTLDGEGADEVLGDRELKAIFREKLAEFEESLDDERERFIFEKRLVSEEPMTLQDIGAKFGVSRERARQLEARLVKRLREYMESQLPDFGMLVVEGME